MSHVTAVLTGAGSGIGLMIAQALVANGARVYVVDRRQEALNTVVKLYNIGPGEMMPQVYPPLPGNVSVGEMLTADGSQICSRYQHQGRCNSPR